VSPVLGLVVALVVGAIWTMPEPPFGLLALDVPLLKLSELLFFLAGCPIGAALAAHYAAFRHDRGTKVLTENMARWLMFRGPRLAIPIGVAVFMLRILGIIPDRLLNLGKALPVPAGANNLTELAAQKWNYVFTLLFFRIGAGILVGLGWQPVLRLLVRSANWHWRGIYDRIRRIMGR
jgi:hypothetical protein